MPVGWVAIQTRVQPDPISFASVGNFLQAILLELKSSMFLNGRNECGRLFWLKMMDLIWEIGYQQLAMDSRIQYQIKFIWATCHNCDAQPFKLDQFVDSFSIQFYILEGNLFRKDLAFPLFYSRLPFSFKFLTQKEKRKNEFRWRIWSLLFYWVWQGIQLLGLSNLFFLGKKK